MILRFRIEAENVARELLEDELALMASKFQRMVMAESDLCGKWEATDDVVILNHKKPGTYRGRLVLKFHFIDDQHDWLEADTFKQCRDCGKSVPLFDKLSMEEGSHDYEQR